VFTTWQWTTGTPQTLINSGFIQCCESGSGRIGIILPDPDLYPFRLTVKTKDKVCFLSRKFHYAVQNAEIYYTYDNDEEKYSNL
jgi:hypothetical protein